MNYRQHSFRFLVVALMAVLGVSAYAFGNKRNGNDGRSGDGTTTNSMGYGSDAGYGSDTGSSGTGMGY